MKKTFAMLSGFIFIILVITLTIKSYYAHKICCLNIEYLQNAKYVDIVGEIYLKDYTNIKTVTDKNAIKKIVNYLNNIPLVSVYGYFDESSREFIIPELLKNNKSSSMSDNERYGFLIFYDAKGIEIGRIIFHNEKYIEGLNYHAYKAQNEEMNIISELEELDLK